MMEFSAPTNGKMFLGLVLVAIFLWWVIAGGLATAGALLVLAVGLLAVGYAVYVLSAAMHRRIIATLEGGR